MQLFIMEHVPTTETDPNVFAELNVNYSKALWEFCAKYNIPYIYASSAATWRWYVRFSDKKKIVKIYAAKFIWKIKLDFDIRAETKKNPASWFIFVTFNVFGQFEAHKGGKQVWFIMVINKPHVQEK